MRVMPYRWLNRVRTSPYMSEADNPDPRPGYLHSLPFRLLSKALREFLKNHADRPEAATARRWLDNLANSGKIQR